MPNLNRLQSIAARLDKMTIYEVRQVARRVMARAEGEKKNQIIDAVLSLARAESEPCVPSKRGAPPKSDKVDEELVSDILECRNYFLTLKSRAHESTVTGVSDIAAECSDELESVFAGFLDYAESKYFLFDGEDMAFVADVFVTRFGLRRGDKIEGKVKRRDIGELYGLVEIFSVNGLAVSDIKNRKSFSSLARYYPEKRIYTGGNGDLGCRMCDIFAPVALGQRALIAGTSNSGKTTLLKSIALGICAGYPDLKVIAALISSRPEEVYEFKCCLKEAEIFSTDFDKPRESHARAARLAFEHAKRIAEAGGNAVVIADGLDNASLTADEIKQLLSAACNAGDEGTVTVICTVNNKLFSELSQIANMVISLSENLAVERIYPAIDALKSFSVREDGLLTEGEMRAAKTMRSTLIKNGGAEAVLELFKKTADNAQLVELLNNNWN